MANEAYFFDSYTTLTLETDETTPTSTPVAGITNVEIVPSVSIERLYTGDSIKIEDSMQHEFSVDVSIEFAKWDNTFAEQWLGGGGGTSATSMTDTSTPQKFAINTFDIDSTGGTTLSVQVSGITFEKLPLVSGSNGEYLSWGLEGVGEDLDDASTV